MKIKPLRLALLLGVLATATIVVPAAPAFASLSLYRVDNTSTAGSGAPETVSVSCNGSDDVVGMGGRIVDGGGEVFMTKMYVNSGLDTVTVQGVEASGSTVTTPWSAEVYAVCAPAGSVSGLTLQTSPVTASGYDKTLIAASCSTLGKVALGGGFKIENAGGKVALDELIFNSSYSSVVASAYVHGPVPIADFTLTTQAICATRPSQMDFKTYDSATNSISPKTETTDTCKSGTQAVAAGGQLTGLTGDGSVVALEPHVSAGAGEAVGREVDTFPSQWDVAVTVVCIG